VLAERAPLLARAGLLVDAAGRLASLPALLDGYAPDPARLPALVLALARDVGWEGGGDAAVVAGVAAAVAQFYAPAPLAPGGDDGGGNGGGEPQPMDVDGGAGGGQGGAPPPGPAGPAAEPDPHRSLAGREWAARHGLFPAMKALLRPRPGRARDGSLVLLTSMERLYRVFERCG
jgi:DNA mismatch repair protein MLH1